MVMDALKQGIVFYVFSYMSLFLLGYFGAVEFNSIQSWNFLVAPIIAITFFLMGFISKVVE